MEELFSESGRIGNYVLGSVREEPSDVAPIVRSYEILEASMC